MVAPREVDHGWWTEQDGRRARLTWREEGGELYLYRPDGTTTTLKTGLPCEDVSSFVVALWANSTEQRTTVERLLTEIDARWPQ